jgi:N-acetylglucosamine malate deacetylase 2
MTSGPNSKLPRFGERAESPAWMRFVEPGAGPISPDSEHPARALFLVAHPDDESLGASAALARLPGSVVIYLTDGAPHDSRFWSSFTGSREDYVRARRREAEAALALAGIPPSRILSLNAVDQDSIYDVPILIEKLIEIVRWFRPAILVTHPYEGGHPDHDCAALVANIAKRCVERDGLPLQLLEMCSYHALNGRCETGEFLPPRRRNHLRLPELTIHLSPEEQERKKAMLEKFVSQAGVVHGFRLDPERLREGLDYDFTLPPHDGPPWYELLGWPLDGKRWRELASQALENFGESLCA